MIPKQEYLSRALISINFSYKILFQRIYPLKPIIEYQTDHNHQEITKSYKNTQIVVFKDYSNFNFIIMNFLVKLFGCQDNSQIPLPVLKHKTISETTSSEEFSAEMWIRKTEDIHSKFDYKLISLLGQGAGGKVYLAEAENPEDKKSQGKVALKILSKSKLEQQRNYKKYLILQKRVHSEVKTTFIIKFIECFQSKSNCFIALQYAHGGSVVSFLHHQRRRAFEKNLVECVRFILGCVVLGLKSLHDSKFAYRDLKPENLLITQNGYVKIADFGLAEQLEEGQLIYGCKCGTLPYLAPEMALRQGHNKLVDLWCLGILAFQLFTRKAPFTEMEINSKSFKEIAEASQKTFRFVHPNITYSAQDFITGLLKAKMQNRLGAKGFDEIMNHKFFEGFSWQALSNYEMQSPLLDVLHQFPQGMCVSRGCSSTDEEENGVSYKNVSHFTTEGSPVKKRQL